MDVEGKKGTDGNGSDSELCNRTCIEIFSFSLLIMAQWHRFSPFLAPLLTVILSLQAH